MGEIESMIRKDEARKVFISFARDLFEYDFPQENIRSMFQKRFSKEETEEILEIAKNEVN